MQYQVPVRNSQPLRAALQVLLCFCILLDTLRVVARGGYSCCSSSLTSPSCHCSSLAISCSLSQIMLLQTHRLLLLLLFPPPAPFTAQKFHFTPSFGRAEPSQPTLSFLAQAGSSSSQLGTLDPSHSETQLGSDHWPSCHLIFSVHWHKKRLAIITDI